MKLNFNAVLTTTILLALNQLTFAQTAAVDNANVKTTVITDQPTPTATTVTTTPPTTVLDQTTTTAVQPQVTTTAVQTSTPAVVKQTSVTTDQTTVATKSSTLTPVDVFKQLREGNQRFINGNMLHRDLIAEVNATASTQTPSAVILNCMDSRTPPEIIFDQGIGDIFAIRIAGNIQNDDVLGSMEFGSKIMNAKLIAVIGHTNCGAMRGACEHARLGFLTGLLQKIQPAVRRAAISMNTTDCKNKQFVDEIAKQNVLLVMKEIQARSPVIKKLLQEGKLGLVGGIQDLATGNVTFFDDQAILPIEQATVAPTTHIDSVQTNITPAPATTTVITPAATTTDSDVNTTTPGSSNTMNTNDNSTTGSSY